MDATNSTLKRPGNIRSLEFVESPSVLTLTAGSQPFVSDLNGDQIDDVLFNNDEESTKKLTVAIFNSQKDAYDLVSFHDVMIDQETCHGSPKSPLVNPILSSPHSVSMVDFDGDCMSDLFLTLQEADDPDKKYLEIYLRRERKHSVNETGRAKLSIPGTGSLCLAQSDDISANQNAQLFEFADVDRDGLIDMLFLTSKRTMNFIVNYNLLPAPATYAIEQALGGVKKN